MRTQSILAATTVLSSATAAILPRQSNPGVDLVNAGSATQTFWFCNNKANDADGADPGFTSGTSGCSDIVTSVSVAPSQTVAVSLDDSFKGRVVRTTDTPATWVEIQVKDSSPCTGDPTFCGWGWGDISLEMGCDGAATVGPSGDSGSTVGFSTPLDIVDNAPSAATTTRSDGTKVIAAPWFKGTALNQAAIDYLQETVPGGTASAYINGTSGTNVTAAPNNRFLVTFY